MIRLLAVLAKQLTDLSGEVQYLFVFFLLQIDLCHLCHKVIANFTSFFFTVIEKIQTDEGML